MSRRIVLVDAGAFIDGSPNMKLTGKNIPCEAGEENGVGQVYIYPPGLLTPGWIFKRFVHENTNPRVTWGVPK